MNKEYWENYWQNFFDSMSPDEFRKYCINEFKKELKAFEETEPMTLSERKEVRKWVHRGNSVHSNPWNYAYDNGHPMNILDALRTEF